MMSRVWSFFVHLAKDLHITDHVVYFLYIFLAGDNGS